MIPLTYREECAPHSYLNMVGVFGEARSPTEIKLNNATGEGSIQVLNLEEELQIRIWDCKLATEIDMHRLPSGNSADKAFSLGYYLTPGTFLLLGQPESSARISDSCNTVLISSDAEFRMRLMPHKPLQWVSLCFTAAWLEKNILSDVKLNDRSFHQQLDNGAPIMLFESISRNEEMVIANLLYNKFHPSFGRFYFKSKALNLVTEFFLKTRNRMHVHPVNNHSGEASHLAAPGSY